MYTLHFQKTDRDNNSFKKNVVFTTLISAFLILQVGNTYADVLDLLIEQATHSYPSIKSKEMSQKSAQTDVVTAKLNFLPAASVSYEPPRRIYGGTAYSINAGKDAYTVISVTQPLFGGGLLSSYRQSKANLSAADWALREETENVALRVINAYAQWYLVHKKVQASQESVKEHERLVGLITRRAEAGASPVTDQNLGVSRLLQAKSELASFLSMEITALTTLSQLVGRRLTNEELLNKPLENTEPSFSDDVVAQAISVNPLIKRLEFTAESMRQASKVQRAQAFPQIALQAKREIGNLTVRGVPPSSTVGLVVSYTTGAGFSSISKANSTYGHYQAAMMDVEAAKRDLVVKVNQDVSDYMFAKNREKGLLKNVELTKAVSQSYDRLFLVGKKSWLDLMNAVRERKDTQVSLAEAQIQALATARRLRIYTQGLLNLQADETPTMVKQESTDELIPMGIRKHDDQSKNQQDINTRLTPFEDGIKNIQPNFLGVLSAQSNPEQNKVKELTFSDEVRRDVKVEQNTGGILSPTDYGSKERQPKLLGVLNM